MARREESSRIVCESTACWHRLQKRACAHPSFLDTSLVWEIENTERCWKASHLLHSHCAFFFFSLSLSLSWGLCSPSVKHVYASIFCSADRKENVFPLSHRWAKFTATTQVKHFPLVNGPTTTIHAQRWTKIVLEVMSGCLMTGGGLHQNRIAEN